MTATLIVLSLLIFVAFVHFLRLVTSGSRPCWSLFGPSSKVDGLFQIIGFLLACLLDFFLYYLLILISSHMGH